MVTLLCPAGLPWSRSHAQIYIPIVSVVLGIWGPPDSPSSTRRRPSPPLSVGNPQGSNLPVPRWSCPDSPLLTGSPPTLLEAEPGANPQGTRKHLVLLPEGPARPRSGDPRAPGSASSVPAFCPRPSRAQHGGLPGCAESARPSPAGPLAAVAAVAREGHFLHGAPPAGLPRDLSCANRLPAWLPPREARAPRPNPRVRVLGRGTCAHPRPPWASRECAEETSLSDGV